MLVVQHDVANVVIDVDGDDDRLRCHFCQLLPHGPRLTAQGRRPGRSISEADSSGRVGAQNDQRRMQLRSEMLSLGFRQIFLSSPLNTLLS